MASISGHSAKTSAGASHQNARHIPRSPNAPDPNNVPLPDSYSRLIWARFVLHQDLQTVLHCHMAAFAAIGGVPGEVLYDRMKTAVIGEDPDGLVIYNRALLDLARHYGYQPRACRPYREKTNGK